MAETKFSQPNTSFPFVDISNQVTINVNNAKRIYDKLHMAKVLRLGNLVVGQLRMTLGTTSEGAADLSSSTTAVFIRGLPPPTSLNFENPTSTTGVTVYGVSIIAQSTPAAGAYITSAGNIAVNSSTTISAGKYIMCNFCYIAKE